MRIGLQRALGTEFHFWRSERTLKRLDDRAMDLLTQVGLTDFAQVPTVGSRTAASARWRSRPRSRWAELMLLDGTQGWATRTSIA